MKIQHNDVQKKKRENLIVKNHELTKQKTIYLPLKKKNHSLSQSHVHLSKSTVTY